MTEFDLALQGSAIGGSPSYTLGSDAKLMDVDGDGYRDVDCRYGACLPFGVELNGDGGIRTARRIPYHRTTKSLEFPSSRMLDLDADGRTDFSCSRVGSVAIKSMAFMVGANTLL
jgi:hypothetical protein